MFKNLPRNRAALLILLGLAFLTALYIGQKFRNKTTPAIAPSGPVFVDKAPLESHAPPSIPKPNDDPEWHTIRSKIESLSPSDHRQLADLIKQTNQWISTHRHQFQEEFLATLANPADINITTSFFMINQMAEQGLLTSQILNSVLAANTNIVPTQNEIHYGGSAGQRLDLIKINALDKMRSLSASERASLTEDPTLKSSLRSAIENSANLAVVRGSIQASLSIGAFNPEELAAIVSSRPSKDRFAFEDLLEKRN